MDQEQVSRVPQHCGPGLQSELIEGVGHFLMVQRPTGINKRILAGIPPFAASDVESREVLLAEANRDAARQGAELSRSFMDLCDTEEAASSAGLSARTEQLISAPDGNTINLQVIRPDTGETLALGSLPARGRAGTARVADRISDVSDRERYLSRS